MKEGAGMHSTVMGISAGSYSTGLSPIIPDKNRIEPETTQTEAANATKGSREVPPDESHELSNSTSLSQTVTFANAVAELFNTTLSFNYDERIGQVVVRVKEGNTDEIIRQIPSEQMVELAAKFKSQLRGLILNHQG
jgi:flagellar protein FlaG